MDRSWPSAREAAYIAIYQAWLAMAFVLGGAVGNGITRLVGRIMRTPQQGQALSAQINYPYLYTWKELLTGGSANLARYAPEIPFMFVYGAKKPAQFHTQRWLDYLRSRSGNQVVELRETGHWVTHNPQLSELVERFLDRTNPLMQVSTQEPSM